MPLARKHQLVLLVLAALILFIVGYKYALIREQDNPVAHGGLISAAENGVGMAANAHANQPTEIQIHVTGAVQKPGVYRLPPGSRVVDAVEMAGANDDSALDYLNLAAPLEDGRQVLVPSTADLNARQSGGEGITGSAPALPGLSAAGGLININTADLNELQQLSGIGPSLAQRIIDYRTENGSFAVVDDLMQVTGIGAKRFEQIKNKICVY